MAFPLGLDVKWIRKNHSSLDRLVLLGGNGGSFEKKV